MINTKGITLLELIIAIVLITGVLVTASSFFGTSLYMQDNLNDQTDAQTDANFVLDHMSRNFRRAVSVVQPPNVLDSGTQLFFTVDDDQTPSVIADDDEHQYELTAGVLRYQVDENPGVPTALVTLTDIGTTFTVTRTESNRVDITLTVQEGDETLTLDSQLTSQSMPGE